MRVLKYLAGVDWEGVALIAFLMVLGLATIAVTH